MKLESLKIISRVRNLEHRSKREDIESGQNSQAMTVRHERKVGFHLNSLTATLSRYIGSAGGAGVFTFALGVTMALMIKTEFTATEKIAAQYFEINPVAEDIAPPTRRVRDTLVKTVIVPPPAPRIDTAARTLPSEPIVPIESDLKVVWTPPVIHRGGPVIRIADSEEQPLYRAEPIMPPRAERSGHCLMRFDVSADGAPYNITAASCSQSLFQKPSVKAVSKWKYKAKVVDGNRVARTGLTTLLSFNLTDERGNLIPE
jgi:protein TonB